MFRNKLLWSMGEAERLKGSAPHSNEVIVVFRRHYTRMVPSGVIHALMQNFYREDTFYADTYFTVISLTGPDGTEARKTFETFSERFLRLYPGY